MYQKIFFLTFCIFLSVHSIPVQFPNCQNCYAVTAWEIVKHWKPKLNVSVEDMMKFTHQGCAGGDAKKILNMFFSKTKIEKGTLYKVINLIKRHGPVIIDLNSEHLVTAWKATNNGIFIHDSSDGLQKIITYKDHPLKFNYIVYPIQ